MGEAGAQDGGLDFNRVAAGYGNLEIPHFAVEGGHFGAGAHLDVLVAGHPVHHAADGVLGPFAGRHQLGVAGEDGRPAQPVLLVDQDALPADAGQ